MMRRRVSRRRSKNWGSWEMNSASQNSSRKRGRCSLRGKSLLWMEERERSRREGEAILEVVDEGRPVLQGERLR
jgi:hypothetical protein